MRHVALCFALYFPAGFGIRPKSAELDRLKARLQTLRERPSPELRYGPPRVTTGTVTARKTTDAGFFVLPLLPAGEYSVTVKADGFEAFTQSHVVVDALATVGMNPKLQIGAANQTVTVQEQATILKTDDVALGSSMQNNTFTTRCLWR